MSSDDGTTETVSKTPEKVGGDRRPDPDLDLSYEEAKERADFCYANVFTTEGHPEDVDAGQLRMDFDDPSMMYALLIRQGDSEPAKIKQETISKVTFPSEGEGESGGIL